MIYLIKVAPVCMKREPFMKSFSHLQREFIKQLRHVMAVIKERKDECQFVMCCFQNLQRPAAKNCQGRELKLTICMCIASAIFARRKQSRMRKDSKGEIHKGTGFIAMATPPWWKSEKQNIFKKGRRKKINQCHVPRESRKRCPLRKRVDISTIWWTPPDKNRAYNLRKLLG